jgi:cyclopropane fatty-acyl-phospholipid synthase-like methyltransferase
MNTVEYWNKAALDTDVDDKYICDIPVELCWSDLGYMDGTVLEIGCGVGRLMKRGDYGIDISQNMLDIAKQRKPNCRFRINKNGNIPYRASMFDNVYCYLVFQHLKPDEIKSYMNETYRVLKRGGKFTFQFIVGDEREPLSNHYGIDEMVEMMHKSGFKTVWNKPSVAHELWLMMGATKE